MSPKKRLYVLALSAFLAGSTCLSNETVFAFKISVEILTDTEIAKLSDKDLTNAYIDTVVEVEAAKAFYTTSGFMPKEYEVYKSVLRYRILLLDEMRKRKLDIPQTE